MYTSEANNGLIWAPVSDTYNDWVQIGTNNAGRGEGGIIPCATYMKSWVISTQITTEAAAVVELKGNM